MRMIISGELDGDGELVCELRTLSVLSVFLSDSILKRVFAVNSILTEKQA